MQILKNKNKLVYYDKKILEKIIKLSNNKRGRSRVCIHLTNKSKTNEMIICLRKESFIPPHIHPRGKTESYHVIKGKMSVLLFNKSGKCLKIIKMGDINSGQNFYYRMNSSFYHMPVATSKYCIYHETYSGPFVKKKDVIFPSWSPKEENVVSVKEFLSKINIRGIK